MPFDRKRSLESYYKLLELVRSDIGEKEIEFFLSCGSTMRVRFEVKEIRPRRQRLHLVNRDLPLSRDQEQP
jgi:hypothetical protein